MYAFILFQQKYFSHIILTKNTMPYVFKCMQYLTMRDFIDTIGQVVCVFLLVSVLICNYVLLSRVLLYIHVYYLVYVVMISCTHDKSEMILIKTYIYNIFESLLATHMFHWASMG